MIFFLLMAMETGSLKISASSDSTDHAPQETCRGGRDRDLRKQEIPICGQFGLDAPVILVRFCVLQVLALVVNQS
jgi:hypothetical protein